MALAYSPMSSVSPGGQRDVAVDITNHLETAESITGHNITTDSTGILLPSNVAISSDGKTLTFHLQVMTFNVNQTQKIYVQFTGDSGSAGTYEINQPLIPRLTG